MRREKKSKAGTIIVVLILITLVLVAVMCYIFVLKPSINGYVVNKQVQAQDATLNTILYQIQQQGYAQIGDTQGNTITLIPYVPQAQVQQVQANAQAE